MKVRASWTQPTMITVVLLALASAFFTADPSSPAPARVTAALILFFVLPGYAIDSALSRSADGVEVTRLALIVGFSLCAVVLSAPVLNLLPGGLTARSWAIALCTITLVAAIIATMRPLPSQSRARRLAFSRSLLLGSLISLLFAGGALAISVVAADRQQRADFTQLWMVESQSRHAVSVGITNESASSLVYTVVVTSPNRTLHRWSGIKVLSRHSWTHSFQLGVRKGTSRGLTCRLYVEPRLARPYRTVELLPS